MRRRTLLVGVVSVSLAGPLAGCFGSSEENSERNTDGEYSPENGTEPSGSDPIGDESDEIDGSETEAESEDVDETGNEAGNVAEPPPVTFEGDGGTVTEGFDLIGGFTVIEIEHTGDGNGDTSPIRLIDEEGDNVVQLLSDRSGEWSGEVGETFDAGRYALGIDTGGSWSIEIRQPRPTAGDDPPVEESCITSTVIGPYMLEGRAQMSADYDGDSDFLVRTYDASAETDTAGNDVFDATGAFEDTTTFAGQGLTWITIGTDGDWELEIEAL